MQNRVISLSSSGQSKLSFVAHNGIDGYASRLFYYQIQNDQLSARQITNEFIEFIGTEVGDVSGNGLLDLVSFDRFSNEIMAAFQTSLYQFSPQLLITGNNSGTGAFQRNQLE